ncbi:hypothetical protein JI664_11785 [Rhodobacter sp. NTK016B]|nr:hypothetical protein [Rhodobacter sp. NTK016B]MBN8292645.1 hypothetical protein [Rhodobacter sp. NTK016B]
MSKTRRQKRAIRRNRERVATYLYGADREGAMDATFFASAGGGALG